MLADVAAIEGMADDLLKVPQAIISDLSPDIVTPFQYLAPVSFVLECGDRCAAEFGVNSVGFVIYLDLGAFWGAGSQSVELRSIKVFQIISREKPLGSVAPSPHAGISGEILRAVLRVRIA